MLRKKQKECKELKMYQTRTDAGIEIAWDNARGNLCAGLWTAYEGEISHVQEITGWLQAESTKSLCDMAESKFIEN